MWAASSLPSSATVLRHGPAPRVRLLRVDHREREKGRAAGWAAVVFMYSSRPRFEEGGLGSKTLR